MVMMMVLALRRPPILTVLVPAILRLLLLLIVVLPMVLVRVLGLAAREGTRKRAQNAVTSLVAQERAAC